MSDEMDVRGEKGKAARGFGACAEVEARRREAERARRAQLSRRNDALLESDNFREFLSDLAEEAGYFNRSGIFAEMKGEDYLRGRRDALRDVVNGVVLYSSKGPAWLRDYAELKMAED